MLWGNLTCSSGATCATAVHGMALVAMVQDMASNQSVILPTEVCARKPCSGLERISAARQVVFKIVPLEGALLVNGEVQKRSQEILAEVAIALTLSRLRDPTGLTLDTAWLHRVLFGKRNLTGKKSHTSHRKIPGQVVRLARENYGLRYRTAQL